MPRTFVALALPESHRAALGRYLARCAAAAPGFRWVGPESLHLTLRFLGGVDDAQLGAVIDGLRRIEAAPFEARLGGLGTFGGRRAAVAWLSLVEGREAAAGLAAGCERECREAGLEAEERPFRPHVTMARARDRRGAELPELPEPPELPGWRVEEFILYESRLHGSRPPEYVPLERFPLRG